MALNYTTITGTFDDGTGTPLNGTAVFTPTQPVYAAGTPLLTPTIPVTGNITNGVLKGPTGAALQLLATDNTGLTFEGLTSFFYWTVTITLAGITQAPWSFALPSIPATVDLFTLANTPGGGMGGTMTRYLAPAVVNLTFGASIAVNAALGNSFNLTLTASTGTLANPTNPVDGQTIRVRITMGAPGSFTLAYGTTYDFGQAGAPVLSTAAGKVDVLGFEYVASLAKWVYLGSALGN